MANCYIFGFGGSGARVIESFIHLLAAASSTRNSQYQFLANYTFVPILVDLDQTNGNKARTTALLRNYQKVAWKSPGGFGNYFGAPIKSINEVCSLPGSDDVFELGLDNANQSSLADMLEYQRCNVDDRHMIDLLFKTSKHKDRDLLNMSLNVGFKGGPHVGSVVMARLEDEESIRNFCNQLTLNDRGILIASSFGGTGAAGAPLFARMLRGSNDLPNDQVRKSVQLGLVSVLPYFNLEDAPEGMVQPSSFIVKTKAALTFYNENKDFSAIYYTGTRDLGTTYKYSEGGGTQNNEAHLVELVGGMAIFKFLKHFQNNNTWNRTQEGFDYALANSADAPGLFHLKSLADDETKALFYNTLPAFHFFYKYYENFLPGEFRKESGWVKGLQLKDFATEDFWQAFKGFMDSYSRWLADLGSDRARPAFLPYNLQARKSEDVLKGITGHEVKLGFFGGGDVLDAILTKLNELAKTTENTHKYERFLTYFTKATRHALKKYESKTNIQVEAD